MMKKIFLLSMFLVMVSCDQFYEPSNRAGSDLPDQNEQRPEDEKPQTPVVPQKPEIPSPSCESICDNSESIINANNDGYGYLAFENFGYQRIGRCRGHALMTQRMAILARFSPQEECRMQDTQCLNETKAGIDKVFNNKTFNFKGVRNLYELSQNPKIKKYMKEIIRKVSHRYMAGPGYIENQSYGRRSISTFYELKRRVELNQIPYVGVIGRKVGSHALLVTGSNFINGKTVLCARDPNVVLGYSENCDNYFYEDDGQVVYKRHDWMPDYLSYFGITDDEDKRIKIYINSLYNSCLVESKSEGLCK